MNGRDAFNLLYLPLLMLLILKYGCSTPNIKIPESLPAIVKEYKHIRISANYPGMINTGIYLNGGDLFTILAKGSITLDQRKEKLCDMIPNQLLILRYGDRNKNHLFFRYALMGFFAHADYSDYLYMGIHGGWPDMYGEPTCVPCFEHHIGSFDVDIIIWEKVDYVQIADFFKTMREKDPDNEVIIDALKNANAYKEIYLAQAKASKEIEETKKELQGLKGESEGDKGQAIKITPVEKPLLLGKASQGEGGKEERIGQLEGKLAKLTETLEQLDEMKKQLDKERKKTKILSQELAEKKEQEKKLLNKLQSAPKSPPVIVIASPRDRSKVEVKIINLSGVAEDDQGLKRLEIFINDKPLEEAGRGFVVKEKGYPKRLDFKERIPLQRGENRIKIRAVDSDDLFAEEVITVDHIEKRRTVWAVVVGINDYPNIRKLGYAVNDARAFYEHLVNYNRIAEENVTLLLNQGASLTKLRGALGTQLKNEASKEDMVIVYFAGHGATERDAMSPDGDGLEKYLLPYGADPKDLYATALPMREISHIFNRIRAERLVFIVDSCYSGASGGRTISLTGVRSNISDTFLERVVSGKGRVIITASGAKEVSVEDEKLRHGVFTYYLLEGLKGKADSDKDGIITVDEAYRYVSKEVPNATGQEQHPVKKGTVEGQLILGVVD